MSGFLLFLFLSKTKSSLRSTGLIYYGLTSTGIFFKIVSLAIEYLNISLGWANSFEFL